MRIVHFADLHIGVEQYGRFDPRTGFSTRLQDFLDAFDELVEYAIAQDVDLVLFAGDAYKTREPTQTQQREFAKRIRRLTTAGIPVFLLIGNHDLPKAFWRANTLEIFDTLGIERVYVGNRLSTYFIPTKSGTLQIVAVPWPNVSQLLANEELKNLPIDQINQKACEIIANGIHQCAEALDPELPCILTAHISMPPDRVREASERWMTVGWHPLILRSDLSPEYFDYVALGHHHAYQVIGTNPYIVYPGSMQRVDFGEERDPKGFVVVTLDPAKPRGQRAVHEPEFREVKARRFVTIRLAPRHEDPTPEVLAAIERADIKDAIVRVILELQPEQERLLQETTLRRALQEAHFLAGIIRNVEQRARRRLPQTVRVESLTPMEALRLYFEERNMPPDRRGRLLAYAQRLIEESAHEGDSVPGQDQEG